MRLKPGWTVDAIETRVDEATVQESKKDCFYSNKSGVGEVMWIVPLTKKYLYSGYMRTYHDNLAEVAKDLDGRRRYRIVTREVFNPIHLLLHRGVEIKCLNSLKTN